MTATNATSSDKNLKYKPGQHPNSRKNLNPGYHGQNNGQNGYSLTSELKHALQDRERRKLLIASTIEGAIAREVTPFKEVWDRVEGKVPDKTAIMGDIVIEVVFRDLPQLTNKGNDIIEIN